MEGGGSDSDDNQQVPLVSVLFARYTIPGTDAPFLVSVRDSQRGSSSLNQQHVASPNHRTRNATCGPDIAYAAARSHNLHGHTQGALRFAALSAGAIPLAKPGPDMACAA
eukprot:3530542-Rhodomonas_salina.2